MRRCKGNRKISCLIKRAELHGCSLCAPIAQLVEHLICNQRVGSSSLSGGTILQASLKSELYAFAVLLVLRVSEPDMDPLTLPIGLNLVS